MKRAFGAEALTQVGTPSVVTLGKFSALHRGHQALLQATVAKARERNYRAVAATFDRHPQEVLRPGTAFPLLATLDERLELIAAQGIDLTVVFQVTPEFLAQEPETFVRETLVDRLGARELLTGPQFRFGHRARGDHDLLERMGRDLGFTTTVAPPVLDGGERISSSRIVACVQAGDVAAAARLLGRPYRLSGEVIAGDQVGRRLGFPTANLAVPPDRLLPADGVYLVEALIGEIPHPAVANLGVRPTVDGVRRVLEAHVLDWSGDLYQQQVTLQFRDRVRDEQKFPSLEALQQQIAADITWARQRIAET